MAIRKKFIGADQVDGSKISLLNNQSLVGQNASGVELPILKIDADGKLQFEQMPNVSANPTEASQLAHKGYVDAAIAGATISIAQSKYVTATGNDSTGDGSLAKPFATVSAALASITDASPSKRYAIHVAPGNYTEGSGLALKANVFVIGADARLVRITGAVSLASDFSGSGDHRSGFAKVTILSAVNLNWATVTSAAGKIYCRETLFNTTVALNGHNNATAQAQFEQCQFFGAMTVSGINVGAYVDNVHFSTVTLNQHPNGGMATILVATGCRFGGAVVANATVNDFNRRCSLFLHSCFVDALTVNGASAYADLSNDSVPRLQASATNGGNLVYLSPVSPAGIQPDAGNSRYIGDFGKQWFFNFAYVHASTGTDLYLTSTAASFGPDSAGRSVYIQPDGYGLNANVNGGDVVFETAAVSGTGVRGKVEVKARQLDMNSVKIVELAAGTDETDAVNKGQLDAVQDQVDTLNGDSSVVGSVDKKVADAIAAVVDAAPEAFDTLKEIADWIAADETGTAALVSRVDTAESGIDALEGRMDTAESDIDALQTAVATLESSVESHERIALTAGNISNGYIDLAAAPKAGSTPKLLVYPDRLWLAPIDDFTLAGARITWNVASVGPGGEEALVEGDIVHVWYVV